MISLKQTKLKYYDVKRGDRGHYIHNNDLITNLTLLQYKIETNNLKFMLITLIIVAPFFSSDV